VYTQCFTASAEDAAANLNYMIIIQHVCTIPLMVAFEKEI